MVLRAVAQADGIPALSIYFRDPEGNLLDLMAEEGNTAR
jgi:catechol-2,3-dioxygenase